MFWTVLYAVLAAFFALRLLWNGPDKRALFYLALLIVVWLIVWLQYMFLHKIQYNAMAKLKDAENEYLFCDNILKIYTRSADYNAEAEVEYSFFVKVYETSKHLFLYQTKNQVFIVDKSTIEGGTAEDIRNKLFGFLKNKYIVCKY